MIWVYGDSLMGPKTLKKQNQSKLFGFFAYYIQQIYNA